jgi:hypothetical protein
MRARDRNTNRPWVGLVLLGGLLATVSILSALELAQVMIGLGPHVGDMIAFEPDRPVPGDQPARVTVYRAGQAKCVLDVTAMHQGGGSLITEERRPGRNPLLKVHWSGRRTSEDADNCGAAADLMLRASDLELLASSVGGFGVGPAQLVLPVAWGHPEYGLP